MKRIILKESEFRTLIKETIKKIINESTRDDLYKDRIEKDFPGALESWDGVMPLDSFYLDLYNDRKEKDKLVARELRKQKTIDRNKEQKEYDKLYRKQNPQPRLNPIQKFVNFLPDSFVSEWEGIRDEKGWDRAFYYLVHQYLDEYSFEYPKTADSVEKMIYDSKYEDYLFKLLDDKYGKHSIEW